MKGHHPLDQRSGIENNVMQLQKYVVLSHVTVKWSMQEIENQKTITNLSHDSGWLILLRSLHLQF